MQQPNASEEAPIDLSLVHVKAITGRLHRVYETGGRVAIACIMRYVVDAEKMQERLMAAAVARIDARRSGQAVDHTSDPSMAMLVDDDDDDEAEEADDEDDSEDFDSDEEPKPKRRRKATKMQRRRFVVYVNMTDACVLSPLVRLDFMPRQGATVFPFKYEDLELRHVLCPKNGVVRETRLINALNRVAGWAVPRSTTLRTASSRQVVETAEAGMHLLQRCVLANAQRMEPLLAHTFRAPEFYALIGILEPASVHAMDDIACRAIVQALAHGEINKIAFSTRDKPLAFDVSVLSHRRGLQHLEVKPAIDDLEDFAALVTDPARAPPPLVPRGRAFACAVLLWRRWRSDGTGIGGGTAPNAGRDAFATEVEYRAALGYMLTNRTIAIADGVCIPRQTFTCMQAIRVLGRDRGFKHPLSILEHTLEETFQHCVRTAGSVRVLCPTMQVCREAQVKGCRFLTNMSDVTEPELQEALTNKDVVVLAEAHLFAVHQVALIMKVLRVHMAQTSRPVRVHIQGARLAARFPAVHGIPFPFRHILEGHPQGAERVWGHAGSISLDHLGRARAGPLKIHNNLSVRLVEIAPPAEGDPPNKVTNEIVSALRMLIADCAAQGRPPYFAFETRAAMEAVMSHPEILDCFPRDTLVAGGWAEEADGGIRRISKLWRVADNDLNPTLAPAISLAQNHPKNVLYAFDGFKSGEFRRVSTHPIHMRHHGLIGEGRFATCEGLTFIGIFTQRGAPLRDADLRWLVYVTKGALVVLVANKPNGLSIAHDDPPAVNVYDIVQTGDKE